MKKEIRYYDAIVIGGGLVGSYAAKELCEQGLKTLLLERGPEKQHPQSYSEVTTDPWDFKYRGLIDDHLRERQPVQSKIYRFTAATANSFVDDQRHPYTTAEKQPYDWFRAYQLGGKSLQWGRLSLRFAALNFAENAEDGQGTPWPFDYDEIEPFYTKAEQFVGVAGQAEGSPYFPDGDFLPPMAMNDMDLLLKQKMAKRWPERLYTIGRTANLTQPKNGRGSCMYRDKCASGCPHGGYYSALSGALPTAMATGNLTIRCDAIVERLVYDKAANKARAVRVLDANTMTDTEYMAPIIFVCAGTLNSTRLLLHSATSDGVGLASGELGHNLMDHHMTSVSAALKNGPDTYPLGRRPTHCLVPRYQNLPDQSRTDFLRGYGLQISTYRENWERNLYHHSLIGSDLKQALLHKGHWRIHILGMGEVLPHHDNRVMLDSAVKDAFGMPVLRISAKYMDNEIRMNRHMLETSKELLTELGAEPPEAWTAMSDPGASIHEVGTARMGSDPQTSVLDPFNRMWEASNVYVTDGAALPSSAWQNPSLTLMAMTSRAVRTAVRGGVN